MHILLLLLLLEPAEAADPKLLAAVDARWALGGESSAEEAALLAAIAEDASDYELQWRFARLRYRQADRERDSARAGALAKEGWDAAKQAQRLSPGRVEGHYWIALNAGIYARNAGVVEAIRAGIADAVLESAEAAARIDPAYEQAGPLRVLGAYWLSLPWPLSDLEKAQGYLQRAVAMGPKEPSNHLFLARAELALGDEAAARECLAHVLELAPEGSGPRREAQALLQELNAD